MAALQCSIGMLGVLTELMGVPEEDIGRFYEWTEGIEAAQRSLEQSQPHQRLIERDLGLSKKKTLPSLLLGGCWKFADGRRILYRQQLS